MPSPSQDLIKSILDKYKKKQFEIHQSDKSPGPEAEKEIAQYESNTLEGKRYESDTEDRKWLAQWAAFTVTTWLIAVMTILFTRMMFLSENIVIALLGTTTLNILGLAYIVLRGHFK